MIDTVALREKVLDLAIRGKLVPQDPNDEPASVLLERIRAQKQQMVKDGKLKPKDIKDDTIIFVGDDNLHYEKFADGTVKCIEDEITFELPEGWTWCRLSQIITLYSGQDLEPSRYNDKGVGIPYITGASNLENGKVIINRWTDSPTTHATTGDLLITCKGSGVGKMAWCDISDAHIARQIMALRCIDGLFSNYLEIVISAMLTKIKSKAPKALDVKKLVGIAMFAALAYIATFIFRINVMFLTFDVKDAVITIASFIYGPIAALVMSLTVALLELITISGTGVYGFIMNFLSTATFSLNFCCNRTSVVVK